MKSVNLVLGFINGVASIGIYYGTGGNIGLALATFLLITTIQTSLFMIAGEVERIAQSLEIDLPKATTQARRSDGGG